MNRSEDVKDLFAALSLAQAEFKPAIKDVANTYFKSKYADLTSIWEAARIPLTKNGLTVIQTTKTFGEGLLILETILAHKSGQWISGEYPIQPQKPDPQAMGSAMTYARRYSLAAIIGIVADEDDDGEAAMNRGNSQKPEPSKLVIHTTPWKPGLNPTFTDYYKRAKELGVTTQAAQAFKADHIKIPDNMVKSSAIGELIVELEKKFNEVLNENR